MKIVDKRNESEITYADLKPGDVFQILKTECIYIKTTEHFGMNAFHISDGRLCTFTDDTKVKHLQCELVITG